MTFTLKDLILGASVLGPAVAAALGVYMRMRRTEDNLAASVATMDDHISALSARIDDVDRRVVEESRDVRSRVTEGHNRLNPIESRLGQIEGWKEAMVKKC